MSYWQLLGRTAILITALCVGIYFYAKWDVQRFEESLGEPYTPVSQTIEPTENLDEQTTFGKTVIFETTETPMFVKQEEAEPHTTIEEIEESLPNEFSDSLDELGDEEFTALFENPDTTETVDDTVVDLLEEQLDNSWKISIEGLDAAEAGEWIEINGTTINLEDLGDNVIFIDATDGRSIK
ncbi:hypothetical protein J5I95_19225 [Candidatus Poribacteria bacterium]|nr:hypothetical protein [Candidatus Poribacteria bacterium]